MEFPCLKATNSHTWWYKPIIPTFEKLEQKNLRFETNYIVNSRPT